MSHPDPRPAPDADVTGQARAGSGRIVAILLAAGAGVLLTRVMLLIVKALPLPGVDHPDWMAPVVGTAGWWLPVLVGVMFAFSESGARAPRPSNRSVEETSP